MTVKTVIMVRRGSKTSNNHITPDCQSSIRENGIPYVGTEVNRIHKGSVCIRTFETAEPFMEWLKTKGGKVDLPLIKEDERFGSDELFGQMMTPKFKEAKKNGKSNFAALRSMEREDFAHWSLSAHNALKKLFSQLRNGDVCLSITHSPIIEMIANGFLGWQMEDLKLKELEGFRFMRADNGRISLCGLAPINP